MVISSQDSQWIILFKYDGGVLSYMFFYSLVIAQSLRIHILCSDFLCVWQAVVFVKYVWTYNAKSLDFHEMTVLLFIKCVRLHSPMKTNLIYVQPAVVFMNEWRVSHLLLWMIFIKSLWESPLWLRRLILSLKSGLKQLHEILLGCSPH